MAQQVKDLVLLQLWHRSQLAAQVQSLAWKLPHATDAAPPPKKKNLRKEKKKRKYGDKEETVFQENLQERRRN